MSPSKTWTPAIFQTRAISPTSSSSCSADGAARRGRRPSPRGRAKPEPQRGADVEHPVTLTFEQAARGVTLPLQINRDGKLETIDIKIPPGVKDGSRIRIRGRGQQAGGEPGDLFIITQVLPHPYFRREGLDILLDLPLSLYEALLGAKVSVPTLDGPVTLTIPPGTEQRRQAADQGPRRRARQRKGRRSASSSRSSSPRTSTTRTARRSNAAGEAPDRRPGEM